MNTDSCKFALIPLGTSSTSTDFSTAMSVVNEELTTYREVSLCLPPDYRATCVAISAVLIDGARTLIRESILFPVYPRLKGKLITKFVSRWFSSSVLFSFAFHFMEGQR